MLTFYHFLASEIGNIKENTYELMNGSINTPNHDIIRKQMVCALSCYVSSDSNAIFLSRIFDRMELHFFKRPV